MSEEKIDLRRSRPEKGRRSASGRWGLALSILALLFSLGSGYVAVNSAYMSWEVRSALEQAVSNQQQRMDQLMDVRTSAPAAAATTTAKPADTAANSENADNGLFLGKINVSRLFKIAPTVTLTPADPASGISGQVWMAEVDGRTFYRVGLLGLPALPDGQAYYLWQTQDNSSPQAYPIGRIEFDAAGHSGRLTALKTGDWTGYGYLEVVAVEESPEPVSRDTVMYAQFPPSTGFSLDMDQVSLEKYPEEGMATTSPTASTPSGTGNAATTGGDMSQEMLLQALMGSGSAGSPAGDGLSPEMAAQLQALLGK